MNRKTSEFREKVADMFVKSLQENALDWKKGWQSVNQLPQNAVTGKNYKGLNRFWLSLVAQVKGLDDPRWATFRQIQDKGWKLVKGAKGMEVEYWSPYDFQSKKNLSWKDYEELLRNPENKEHIGIIAKYYHVFNAKDIEGIPELTKESERQIVSDEIISKLSENMGVPIVNDGGNHAFYRVTEDKIHLPAKEHFYSDYEYNATALHELSHATGAAHRLDRNLQNKFGSQEYAYEELVAEISSCFMGEHLTIEQSQEHMDNHKAYVQGWIREISEKPSVLIQAIKDADQAANYLEFHAELINANEYRNTLNQIKEVGAETLDTTAIRKRVQNAIIADIQKSGFAATPNMLSNVEKLNSVTGKANTMKDICDTYKAGCTGLEPEAKEAVKKIAGECKQQEMSQIAIPEPEL